MDLTQNVKVVIDGDITNLPKKTQQAERIVADSNRRLVNASKKVGEESGDQFGRAFNRAQDRWMKAAEQGLRRYGGRFGGVLGDIIGQFDSVGKAMESSRKAFGNGGKGIGIGELILGNYISNSGMLKGGLFDLPYLQRKKSQLANPETLERWIGMKSRKFYRDNSGNVNADKIEQFADSLYRQYRMAGFYKPLLGRGLFNVGRGVIGVAGGAAGAALGGKAWVDFMDSQKQQVEASQQIVNNYAKLKSILDSIGSRSDKIRFLQGELGPNYSQAFGDMSRQAATESWKLNNSRSWSTLTGRTADFWNNGIGMRVTTAAKEVAGRLLTGNWSGGATPESQLAEERAKETALREREALERARRDEKMSQASSIAAFQQGKIPLLEQYNVLSKQVIPELAYQYTNSRPEDAYKNRMLLEQAKADRRGMRPALSQLGSSYVDSILAKNPNAYRRKGYVSDLDMLLGNVPKDDPLNPQLTDSEILAKEAKRIRRESGMTPAEIALNKATHPEDYMRENNSYKRVKALFDSRVKTGEQKSFTQLIKSAEQLRIAKLDEKRANFLEQLSKAWMENGGAVPIIPRNGE